MIKDRSQVSLSYEEVEELNKHLNQLQGLVGMFVAADLNVVSNEEHSGAAWLLSDLVDKIENGIQALEGKAAEMA